MMTKVLLRRRATASFLSLAIAIFCLEAPALAQTNPPVITSSTNTLGTVGQGFSYTITASGFPTNFSASNLPTGSGLVSPAPGSAVITGLPQTVGTIAAIITAANSNGTTSTNLSISVNPPAAPAFASPLTVFAVQGQTDFNYPLLSTPNHSNVPTTFFASNLPPGLGLISNSVVNSQYPNVTNTSYFLRSTNALSTSGSFLVPVVTSNAGGAVTNTVTLIITPTAAPVFTVATNLTAFVGVPFSYDATALNSPQQFWVTNIQVGGGAAIGINVTNGSLTNGLSFTNVTNGSTVVGRIFGTPGTTNVITLGLAASNTATTTISGTNITITVTDPVPTLVLSQPLGEANYVAGSSFFVNAQAFDRVPDIIVPSSVRFETTQELPNPAPPPPITTTTNAISDIVGRLGDFYGVAFDPGFPPSPPLANASFRVRAAGVNSLGQPSTSVALGMIAAPPQNPLPVISMLPLNPGPKLQAGGSAILRAKASIPSTRVSIDRVEFYVNKVYVGFSTAPVAGTTDEYNFTWTTPSVAGSYQVSARAVSLNYTTPDPAPFGLPISTAFWASVITRTPLVVNTLPGAEPSIAITSPSANGTLAIGVPNRITATGLLTGGSIDSVEFYANGKLIASSLATPNPDTQVPFEVDFTPNSYGAYELFAIARGSNGLQAVSPVVIARAPSGFVPTVTIDSPSYGVQLPLGSPVAVVYSSQDSDGFVQKLQLLVNGAVVEELDAAADGLIGNGVIPYSPPSQGVYEFVVRVTDNQGNFGESQPVRTTVVSGSTSPLPEVALRPQPIVEQFYVVGSEVFLNATASPKGTNAIPTNGVTFFANNERVAANPSGIPSGLGVFAARQPIRGEGPLIVAATARDSAGNVGVSSFLTLNNLLPRTSLPQVEMLPLNPGTVPAAGGRTLLQARGIFPSGASLTDGDARIEFYVNGAYAGVGTNSGGTLASPDIFQFEWRSPAAPGSYRVEARAVAFNWGDGDIDYYASVISDNFTTVTTGTSAVPVVSIKSPVEGTSVPVGSPITLQSTASIAGSTVARVDYYGNGDFIGSSTTAGDSYSVTYTPSSKGEVTLIAVAVSVKGFEGQSNEVKINVPLTGDPSIKFLSPAEGVTFPPGTTFTAAAEATINSVTKAPIQDVRFFLNEVQQGSPDTTAPYSQQVTLRGVGNYFLKAIVTDIYGSTASVQQVVTCATPTSGNPPIITMTHPTPGGGGDTQNDFSTPSQFFFNAVVTLPGGVSVAPGGVKFFANGVPVEGLVNNIGNTYSVFWQPDRNADYLITAQVTDTRGITGVSEPLEFIIAPVVRPLPTVSLLPLSSASATVGSRVFLQAVSNGSITPVARIDFYANGVLIGSRDVNDPADGSDTTTLFEWTPTVAGNYEITARAIQVLGEVGDNSIISASRSLAVGASSGSTPLVNLLQQPISESIYVHGSQLFLNATAVPRGGATMPDDGVTIYYAGEVLPAVKSGVLLGTSQIYTAKADVFDGLSNITVFATARDSRNAIGSSAAATLFAVRPLFPLPTVTMLPLLGSGPFSASEELTLRARAVFPATANTEARVEFYANGAYLGPGIQDPNNPTTYTFLWETPPTSGTYKIEARALALNFETNTENDNKIRHFGSVISLNSVIAEVEAIPGDLVPGSNEAFVVEMYQDLLYRDPSFEEWFVAKEALNAVPPVIDRASFVMNLMGFDPQRRLFSRVSEFGRTSMTAMLPFYRLGIAPTANQVETFLNLLEADETPLPITGDYSGVPDAPWGATYGMAAAMREAVLRSPQFLFAYPTVTSMPNVTFNDWLRNTMFAGVSGGDESRIIGMMNTIAPQLIKQGAAMAFRSELAWVSLEAGYITVPEQKVQLEAATTILNFQLNGVWDPAYGKKNPYSKAVVQRLLSPDGVAGSGGNVAVFRGPARSYQGLVGNGLTENSGKSARSASAAAPKINGELRVTTSTSGTYSGTLTLEGGAVIRAKGTLNSDGSITAQWAPGLLVNLLPVEDGAARYLGGTLTRGSSAPEDVVAGKQIYSKDSPFASPGNYTLSLRINPAPAATDRLQGSGYATVKIPATGVAKIAGRLADNTPFTASIPVWGATGEAGEEALLVHRILSKGAGSIGGQILRRNRGIGAGDLVWQTAPTAFGPRRTINLDAALSPYSGVLPATGTVLPVGWKWNAPFSLQWNSGDEFGAVGFMTPGTLFGSAAGLSLKINTSSGVVGGSFTDIATGAKYKVNGILDQGTKAVDGFFLTPQSSGRLEINR